MAVSIVGSMQHMAWANQRVCSAVAALPDEALDAYIVDPAWTVGRILGHLLESGEWYRYCLRLGPWVELQVPADVPAVMRLAARLAELDAELIEQATLDDEFITQDLGSGDRTYPRSMILAQSVHHGTEHRAQVVGALEFKGYKLLNLDDIDLWAYSARNR